MNFCELFIRRPVMTTLVMVGILIFGIVALPAAAGRDLPNVDFPTIQVTAQPARREPGDDGLGGGHAAREAVLDHRRHRLDDLDRARSGIDARSRCSSRSTATSTPPRRTCRRRSPRPRASCRRDMPTPPSYQKVNPADSADPLPRAHLDDAAALDGRRVRRDAARAAHLDDQRRGAGAGLRLAEVRRARPARSERAGRARHRHRRGRARRSRSANVNLPTGTLYGPHQRLHRAGHRPAHERRGLPADDRRLSQRRAGAARASSAASSTAWRTTRSPPGSTTTRGIVLAIQRQPGTNTVEVVDAIKQLLPDVPRRSCRRGRTSTSSTTARSRSASRSTT